METETAAAETVFVAIAFGYWGKGKTETAALEQCRRAGAKRGEKTIIYVNNCPAELAAKSAAENCPYVDNYGQTAYFGELTKIATYLKGKRAAADTGPAVDWNGRIQR